MSRQQKLPLQFPKRFLWGAASSAHQVEGGNHNQWSVWELEHAKVLAQKAKYHHAHLPSGRQLSARRSAPKITLQGWQPTTIGATKKISTF